MLAILKKYDTFILTSITNKTHRRNLSCENLAETTRRLKKKKSEEFPTLGLFPRWDQGINSVCVIETISLYLFFFKETIIPDSSERNP